MRNLAGSANPNWKGGLIHKQCEICSARYSVKRPQHRSRFCSLRCVGISQRGRDRSGARAAPAIGGSIAKECVVCSAEFRTAPSHADRFYCCSRKCGGIWRSRQQSGSGNGNWRGGLSRQPYPWDFRFISRAIIARDGFVCSNPGCAGADPRMTAHHIDYDKGNCDQANLIALCSACNSKANFNRPHWQRFYSALNAGGWEQEEFS